MKLSVDGSCLRFKGGVDGNGNCCCLGLREKLTAAADANASAEGEVECSDEGCLGLAEWEVRCFDDGCMRFKGGEISDSMVAARVWERRKGWLWLPQGFGVWVTWSLACIAHGEIKNIGFCLMANLAVRQNPPSNLFQVIWNFESLQTKY